MVTSLLIHPCVFTADYLSDQKAPLYLDRLLASICGGRALIVLDQGGTLKEAIKDNLSDFTKEGETSEITDIRQKIEDIFLSFSSGEIKKGIEIKSRISKFSNDSKVDDQLLQLNELAKPDFVIGGLMKNEKFKNRMTEIYDILHLPGKIFKEIDETSHSLNIKDDKIELFIKKVKKVTKYAKTIKIYDPYVGLCRNVEKYELNLEYILNKIVCPSTIWKKEKKEIIIFTLLDEQKSKK